MYYDGTVWAEMFGVTDNHLYGIWGASPSDVFAAGAFGTIPQGASGADVFSSGYGGTVPL